MYGTLYYVYNPHLEDNAPLVLARERGNEYPQCWRVGVLKDVCFGVVVHQRWCLCHRLLLTLAVAAAADDDNDAKLGC